MGAIAGDTSLEATEVREAVQAALAKDEAREPEQLIVNQGATEPEATEDNPEPQTEPVDPDPKPTVE